MSRCQKLLQIMGGAVETEASDTSSLLTESQQRTLTMAKYTLTHVERFSQRFSTYYIACFHRLVACLNACLFGAQQPARVFQTYDRRLIEGNLNRSGR